MRIAGTPQHVGQAEDVVWEARGDDAFLSSHLVFSSDEHLVDGRRHADPQRTIANCLYRRGRMVEEWVVRDSLAVALQRGLDPDEVARGMRFRGYSGSMTEPAPPTCSRPATAARGPTTTAPSARWCWSSSSEVWNGGDLQEGHRLHGPRPGPAHRRRPDGRSGPRATSATCSRCVAPFPDGQFAVRDVQTNYAERYAGLRIAVIWKLHGAYSGTPDFGPLTEPAGRPPRRLAVPRAGRPDRPRGAGVRRDRAARADQRHAAATAQFDRAPTSTEHPLRTTVRPSP